MFHQWPQEGSTQPAETDSAAEGRALGSGAPAQRKERLPRFPSPSTGPLVAHHLPSVRPAILTEEGTAIEADGGLAGHLRSVEDCIVELVWKGKGLRTVGGRLGVRGSLWSLGHLLPSPSSSPGSGP